MSKTTKKRREALNKYIEKKWEEYYLNFLMKYEDKLNWSWISQNPNITMEMIEKYPDKPWNWDMISRNSNITMEFIEKLSDKPWNWHYISLNKFSKEKELFYEKWYKKYMATFRLQQYFNRMYDNSKYLFCRNRLYKLFTEVS